MAGTPLFDHEAQASRVIIVDTDGADVPVPQAPVQRTPAISRVNTATTTNVAAGKKSYSYAVVASASAASPTLGGVALPAGTVITWQAPDQDTLAAAPALVTVSGDDVIVTVLA